MRCDVMWCGRQEAPEGIRVVNKAMALGTHRIAFALHCTAPHRNGQLPEQTKGLHSLSTFNTGSGCGSLAAGALTVALETPGSIPGLRLFPPFSLSFSHYFPVSPKTVLSNEGKERPK